MTWWFHFGKALSGSLPGGERLAFGRMFEKLRVLMVASLLIAGCDQKSFLDKLVPKEDDAFARRFLDSVRAGDYAAAEKMLDPSLRGAASANGLRELNTVLAHGEPISLEVIGCHVFNHPASQSSRRTTDLSYQIQFRSAWAAGNVVVGHPSGAPTILGSHFQPVPDSLKVLNRLGFAGKSGMHYLVFAACIAIPALILVALVICIRSRVRRKALWMIMILFGFVQFRLNWATGDLDVQPISFLLFGASAFRPGPYSPWILSFAIPIGAILFLLSRRRLLLDDAAESR